MKEKKVGLTPMNYLLSIGGIILLACVIILPPVFRMVFEKEVIIESTPNPGIIKKTLVCHKDNITSINYTDSEAYIFSFKNDILQKYTLRTERVYLDPIFYQEEKSVYGRYVTSFNEIAGYEYSVTPNDDTASFMIIANYDFKSFKPTTIL